jgi:tetratricopeptide (TPR) repeat protein
MNANWTEAHVKLLSVPPLFDESTATDLVSSLSDELVEGSSKAQDFLTSLRLTGLLTGHSGCWQISDATRVEFRDLLIQENPVVFQRALGICVDHMREEFAPTVQRVFGAANASLLISTLALGTTTSDHTAFDNVIRKLTAGHRLGRSSGEDVTRVALAQLPQEPDRFRQMEFLLGMQAWRTHERRRAERHFDRVLTANFNDLADAISAHLAGVAMSKRGEHAAAIALLQRSIGTLRELQDARGLCQALISQGIAEREISAKLLQEADEEGSNTAADAVLLISHANENFQAAQNALEEAIELAQDLQDRHLEGGAHMELAACFARWGDLDTAIYEADTARSIMPSDDPEYVRLLTQLGSFYRQCGDYDNASSILDEAAQIALERGNESIELARLLNVLAANERRQGHLMAARSHAQKSVEIGRKLRDQRHLGHAIHTLAVIAIQDAKDSSQLLYAEQLLSESEQILKKLHDSVGLGMISNTRSYLTSRQGELGINPSESTH